ncbi:MAG: IS66 family transposase [Georgenia sp.]
MSSAEGLSREELGALVAEQAALIADLRAEVAELRARLAANSRNSSRPPSSDGLAKPPAPKSLRRRSGRKQGGQPGHEGRHLQRVERPDSVIVHVPASCDGCGGDLHDGEPVGEEARQVFDLPPVRLEVIEHRAQRRRCACGHETLAPFPAGVGAPAQYGPRVRALGIYLIAAQHLPYQRAAMLLADWLGAPLSPATLVGFVKDGADDLGEFLDQVHEQIIASPVVHFDETGARAGGRLRWLHAASTQTLTFYALHDRRGTEGIDHTGVMPRFQGIAVHDGWPQYRAYPAATHALCNAHHLRELLAIIEQHPDTQSWARQIDALLRALHEEVKAAKATGEDWLDPSVLAGYRAAYEQIIALGNQHDPPATIPTGKRGVIKQTPARNLLTRLDRDREQILRFAHDFQIPFDNNLVERDIRMIKIQQKISGSWRTTTGADHFLALRAYISTTRKQGRDMLDALARLAAHTPWLPAAASP